MFNLTQRYLYKHYDAESGSYTGCKSLVMLCLRFQRLHWWWNWNKVQPSVVSKPRAIGNMVRVLFSKIDL